MLLFAGLLESVSSGDELLSLAEVKKYLGVFTADKDAVISKMIGRAQRWVEDHTGIALVQRQFTERLRPTSNGVIRLSKAPLVTVDSVNYPDGSDSNDCERHISSLSTDPSKAEVNTLRPLSEALTWVIVLPAF
jgi:uncharacterized phiE125 gp8 family phage protein